MRTTRAMFAAVCLVAGGWTQAHGLWVAQGEAALAVVYGEGREEEAYDPARVTDVRAWRADGEPADWRSFADGGRLRLQAPGAARLALRYDAGEWTETRQGRWLPGGRGAGVADARRTWRLLRVASVLLAPADASAPLGLPLEIQPLADPFALRRGQVLPVRVLLYGAPLAGAEVIADFIDADTAPPVLTDADGVARVPLGGERLNVLQTGHAQACEGQCTTDRIAWSATLSFTLPPAAR